jgi:predicted nucleic acid-binding Zn ribbon protein
MKCRECGTEIAEKALICFRCGASVQEAVHKPYVRTKKRRPLIVYVIVAILVVIAIVLMMLGYFPVVGV